MKEDCKKSEKTKCPKKLDFKKAFVLFVFLCNSFHALQLCLFIFTNEKL